MERAASKSERLLQMERLLLAHPEGLTQAELARCLQVHRSTVMRTLPDLPPYIVQDDRRIAIDRSAYLMHVHFNLHEALAVHLAGRLLATCIDRQNRHAAGALRKLSLALEKLAPQISRHVGQSADAIEQREAREDANYLRSLETLTHAWSMANKVRVWHRKEVSAPVKEYVFSPYYIEPNAVGQSTYVIGLREPPGAVRTFKIERIERVELLRERYELPRDFDPGALLADAWGIWYTEQQPVEVALRFSPRVASRVQETCWHHSQQVTQLEDGGVEWRAQVAEPQEMMPWVRGWGADVEVLRPEGMRETIIREVVKLRSLYGDL
jgi:predicted DNA-binding transcriptional regulator YafY